MAVSTLLPMNEVTPQFRAVQQNTLIQHGGWILILAAIAVAAAALRVAQGSAPWWLPLGGCLVAATGIIWWATDTGLRTLYPVGFDGTANVDGPGVVAEHGIAIYVAGLGVALAIAGSRLLHHGADSSPTKQCPDCAETVRADARVCKHCAYRFMPGVSEDPDDYPETLESATQMREVSCHSCGSTQSEALNVSLTACDHCGETMKLKAVRPKPVVEHSNRAVRCSLCGAEQRISSTASRFRCAACQETMTAPPP